MKEEKNSLLNKQILFFLHREQVLIHHNVTQFYIIFSLSICYRISTFSSDMYIATKRKRQILLKLHYFIACFSFFNDVSYYTVRFICLVLTDGLQIMVYIFVSS
jgi:hypothetical protein